MSRLIILFLVTAYCQALEYNITAVPLPKPSVSDSRIIGGSPTTIERYPYTIQVLYNSQLSCGGSLLTRRHVLSAAHCFIDTAIKYFETTTCKRNMKRYVCSRPGGGAYQQFHISRFLPLFLAYAALLL